jgi:hypothetical protein
MLETSGPRRNVGRRRRAYRPARRARARYYADLAAASVPQLPDRTSSAGYGGSPTAPTCAPRSERPRPRGWRDRLRLAGRSVSSGGSRRHRQSPALLALHAADPAPSPDRAAALTFVARLDTQLEAPQSWYAFSRRRRRTTAAAATTTGQQCRPRCWRTSSIGKADGSTAKVGGASQRRPVGLEPSARCCPADGQHERRPAPGGAPAHDRAGYLS